MSFLADLRINLYVPFRLFHKSIQHREPKACALTQGLGGEEGVKGLFDDVGRHPDAGIGHRNRYILTGVHLTALGARIRIIQMCIGGLDGQPATLGHGIATVDGKIQDRTLELIGIAKGEPQAAAHNHFQIDARTQGSSEQVLHFRD